MKYSIIASQYLFKVDRKDYFNFLLYDSLLKYSFDKAFRNFKQKQR